VISQLYKPREKTALEKLFGIAQIAEYAIGIPTFQLREILSPNLPTSNCLMIGETKLISLPLTK